MGTATTEHRDHLEAGVMLLDARDTDGMGRGVSNAVTEDCIPFRC
jgi:hypothetical protein